MSTLEMPTVAARERGALRDPCGRATSAAGALLVGALALALADVGGATLPLSVAGAGVVAALFVLAPGAARRGSAHPVLTTAGAAALAGAVLLMLAAGVFGTWAGGGLAEIAYLAVGFALRLVPLVLIVAAAVTGLVLLAVDLRARLGSTTHRRTPWHRVTGRTEPAGAAPPSVWRGLAGLTLIVTAAVSALVLAGYYLGGAAPFELLVLMVVAGAGLAVIATPVLVAGLARADRGRSQTVREDERQRMAAHLHDSVLQTLALVQRQAHDPAAVSRLVRRQEHELRAWMAGEAELGSETLGAALRDAVAEVEDEHETHVEVTILGDRPLDPQAEALAAAAREALRNAARHAPGAPVFVFAQAGPDGAEVFVRDEGGGFELDAVPTERRGVRDAIVGRMAAAGGRATVESVPGEGTEVVLRIDAAGRRS